MARQRVDVQATASVNASSPNDLREDPASVFVVVRDLCCNLGKPYASPTPRRIGSGWVVFTSDADGYDREEKDGGG